MLRTVTRWGRDLRPKFMRDGRFMAGGLRAFSSGPLLSRENEQLLRHLAFPNKGPGGQTVSMGYDTKKLLAMQGTIGDFLRLQFSEVTNPNIPYAQNGELCDTSFVFNGVKFDTPIVKPPLWRSLCEHFESTVINTEFNPATRKEGLLDALAGVDRTLAEFMLSPTPLIILNEPKHDAVDRTLVVSKVDAFLRDNGLRESTIIGIHTQQMLFPSDIYHVIQFGGHVICPEFMFNHAESLGGLPKTLMKNLTQEIIACMCAQGITSLTACIGNRAVTGNGLSQDVLNILGCPGEVGDVGLQRSTRMQLNLRSQSRSMNPDNLNRLWDVPTVRQILTVAEGKKSYGDFKLESAISGVELKPTQRFTPDSPLDVYIIGGGVAANALCRQLKQDERIHVTMFEQRVVNRAGLGHLGVHPQHGNTRRLQATIMEENLTSKNVTYLGGVTLSQKNIEHLQTCGVVVNATGADQPKRLGIPGEDHPCVIDAQDIWARVNSRVDLTGDADRFPIPRSFNPKVGIIGFGNVTKDVVANLMDPMGMIAEDVDANHEFLLALANKVPSQIRIMVRGKNPATVKVGMKELNELLDLPSDLRVSGLDADAFGDDDKSRFFEEIYRKGPDYTKQHSIEIVFGFTPQQFNKTEDPKEVQIQSTEGRKLTFGYIIKSLGTESSTKLTGLPAIGWANSPTGAIGEANHQAKKMSDEIKSQYLNQPSPFKKDDGELDVIAFRSPINNDTAYNLIRYLQENPDVVIKNKEGLKLATMAREKTEPSKVVAEEIHGPVNIPAIPPPPEGEMAIVDSEGNATTFSISQFTQPTLYHFLKEKAGLKPAECDGDGICGECVVQSPSFGSPPPDEKMVFDALGIPIRQRRLACQISPKDQKILDRNIIKLGGSQ